MAAGSEWVAGKTVLVTGATGGIGLETARILARKGARVVVGARDPVRGRAAVEEIVRAGGHADLLEIDMLSFESVRKAAPAWKGRALDVLINNAGIVVRERQLTADGHERTWQTNFLSHFLLTRLLLPSLRAAPSPRIVNVSSEAHRSGRMKWEDLELEQGYRGFFAYANTKLAQVLFTRELARREPGIAVNALHPGAIATGIWRAAPAFARAILNVVLPPPEKGARPVVRVASDPALEGVTGRYVNKLKEVAPSPAGSSDHDAARLWKIAEESVGPIP
ncbi:MAG TPA: SDR family NAD(P)-dependent oxidoreductase [Thermoanaerobaculia bacterium]|nr:SDR family NAD(P)-dependent oxidoreductase [Thermoanaerobaculia bacterium]